MMCSKGFDRVKIDEMNYFHDSEVIEVSYKNSLLSLSLGYIPNKAALDYAEKVSERKITFSGVKNLVIVQSPNFGRNYTDIIEEWHKKNVRDLNKLISKGTLEFLSVEQNETGNIVNLFWSSSLKKIFYKRTYIQLTFSQIEF